MGDLNGACSSLRYTSLDGLRGVAAFVVLLHHCFLISPVLNQAAQARNAGTLETWAWWVTFTPLHLMWAGGEAVFVFFILSGFVLALPFLGGHKPSWAAYLPKRLIRIYLPVWASLLLALWATRTFPRTAAPQFSPWVNQHDEAPNVLRDGMLIWGTGNLNSPLWSLQWEMAFSVLLPVYVITASYLRRRWLACLAVLVILIGIGEVAHVPSLVCLPMFGVGVLMATGREALNRWASKINHWGWTLLVLLSLLLLSFRWMLPPFAAGIAISTIGGAVMLFAFIGCRSIMVLASRPRIQWLGTRSFSLYLIHEPVVVSVAFYLQSTNPLLVAAYAVPLSLLITEVFFRLVERPSHRLAKAAGFAVLSPATKASLSR